VKLSIFVPDLTGGGAERMMVNVANAAAARGLAVTLLLSSRKGPHLEHVRDDVRIVTLGRGTVRSSLVPLMRHLRRDRPDAVLSALDRANVVLALAKRLSGASAPAVISQRNLLAAPGKPFATLSRRLVFEVARRTYPWADGVIAISDGVAANLLRHVELSPERITTIYNPVVSDDLLQARDEPLDHPWFAPGEPAVVLGAGRLTRQKGFDTLVKAFAMVRAQRNCRLVILGEGELRAELEGQVASLGLDAEVAFPGFVSNPYAWMRRSSVFVFSSRWEGLGNVLIEAMACGTPVVSTDCESGPSEILEGGRWGRLVPVDDVTALAAAIQATLEDPEPPAVELRASEFTIERAVDAYLAVLGLAP
jgi:glycosyltransferase involved in cell wall biosynthesis